MPLYQYSCTCGKKKDVIRSFSDNSDEVCECSLTMSRDFAPSLLGHVRGSTPSKAYRESRVRMKRNAELGVRQIERYGSGSTLVPNVGGQEVGTWADAAKLAKSEGKDVAKFEKMAEQEKNRQNSRGLDEAKWKKAKEELKRL